MNFKSGN